MACELCENPTDPPTNYRDTKTADLDREARKVIGLQKWSAYASRHAYDDADPVPGMHGYADADSVSYSDSDTNAYSHSDAHGNTYVAAHGSQR